MKQCPFCAEEIQDAARVCKHCGRDLEGGASQVQIVQPKKKTGCVAAGCGVFLVIMLIGAIGGMFTRPKAPTTTGNAGAPPPAARISPRDALQRDVKVDGSWSREGFGNVAMWNITLRNTSKFTTWKDVQYQTEYQGESGKRLTTRRGEFNIVLKPGQTRRIAEHNDGFIPQGARRAAIELIGGVYDTLTPPAAPAPKPSAASAPAKPAPSPSAK